MTEHDFEFKALPDIDDENLENMRGILRDVEEIERLSRDMNEVVLLQGDRMRHISDSTDNTLESAMEANVELKKAAESSYTIAALVIGGIAAINFPVVWVFGLKAGLASGAGTAAVALGMKNRT
jgi:hypothetical protein